MFINLKPLIKYRDFRLLYFGQFISWFGNGLSYVALPYQIYHLTRSSLAVGSMGLVQLLPLLVTSLWGGALADRWNRKKILLSAEFGLCLMCFVLLINALSTKPHVWVVYVVAAVVSALSGFHRPSLEAITPRLVERDDLPAVASLSSLKYSVNTIVGPALAGIIIAKFGIALVFFIDLLSYLFSILAIVSLKSNFAAEKSGESVVKSIKSGFQYAMSRQELIGTYVVDIVAMIFGMPMALFPAIAETLGGVKVLGWLYAAPSIGFLLASLFSGWTSKVQRHGVAISIAASIWGLAIIGFGFSKDIIFAVFFLIIAGAADDISGIFRGTLWNQTIPNNLRGRLAGVEMLSYMSGPLLGNAEAGLVAAAFGTTFSVISGGVLCVIGVGISVLFLPRFWNYHAEKWRLENTVDKT